MDAVDGNAIGGLLQEGFGSEMPTVRICGTRGTAARSASLPATRMRSEDCALASPSYRPPDKGRGAVGPVSGGIVAG
jgi:hypothetical protein